MAKAVGWIGDEMEDRLHQRKRTIVAVIEANKVERLSLSLPNDACNLQFAGSSLGVVRAYLTSPKKG